MNLSNETLDLILGMLIKHEDETSLTREELWACVAAAVAAGAPQYITEHFARKAVAAVN